jgi:Amt family ammonium transporter
MQGGVIGLIGAWLVGPRYGKYNKDGSMNAFPPHSIPMAIAGTFILAFGWFGFNPGSTLAGTDLRISVVAVNTMLASATGAIAATMWMWWFRTKKPDPSMACNGMLAGLVAITAPCAFVSSVGACIIGLIAGILVVESVFFFDKVARVDDPVGAISVHGVNGAWGCLSIGLFADGTYGDGWNGVSGTVKGLFYGGGLSQFWAELIGVVTCFVTLAVLSFILFKLVDVMVGNRVEEQVEIDGLDIPEMGIPGYGGVVMDKDSETPRPRMS